MSAAPSPIRLLSLDVENFRGLGGKHSLDLSEDLTLIVGKNGAGKSSLLVAVEWCLFGPEITSKTGSGIPERGDWALPHAFGTGEVRVTLEIEVANGHARLCRRRPLRAAAREEDDVQLTLPEDEVLRGPEVQAWMSWNNMPDWSTWKRSFCQHQEQSRARVTDTAGRSSAIAGMLGLDDCRTLNDELKKLKVKGLEQRATDELVRLQDDQARALERPGMELRDRKARLARCGLAVTQAGGAELEARKIRLLAEASKIAAELNLDEALMPREDATANEVKSWAQSWSGEVRGSLETLSAERVALTGRVQLLEAAIGSLGPARLAASDAKRARERLVTEFGAVDELHARHLELEKNRADLEQDQRRRDAVGQLIQDAFQVVKESQDTQICPVCDQTRNDLEQVIQSKLNQREPDALQEEFAQIQSRSAKLQEQIKELTGAEGACEAATSQVEALEQKVRGQLPAGTADGTGMDELLLSSRASERTAFQSCEAAERHISEHRTDLEIFELLIELRDARARSNVQIGEISETPEFMELQRAIDEAAGFASDLEALRAMARLLEDEQSTEQISAVNESIDTYFSMITGDPERGRVRVQSKRTATRVSYQLVDQQGHSITSHLNQAAFNALSLAMLFASAESRARNDLPQFLVLDDPGQNLDDEHQAGLARALAKCASFAPVIVATFSGTLADAMSKATVQDSREYLLARTDDGTNTMIREV